MSCNCCKNRKTFSQGQQFCNCNLRIEQYDGDPNTNQPVAVQNADTLRFWSDGSIFLDLTPGSANLQIETNNIIGSTGAPTSAPPGTDRPAIYIDFNTTASYGWNGSTWMAVGTGATGQQGATGVFGQTGPESSQFGPFYPFYGYDTTGEYAIELANKTPSLTYLNNPYGNGHSSSFGVLVNTNIYSVPFDGAAVLKLNTTNDTTSFIGTGLTTQAQKWYGGVLAPNGSIYCVPYTATSVLKIDTTTDGVTYIGGGLTTQTQKWVGGILAPNGFIYCIPYFATSVLRIDPATDGVTYVAGGLTTSTHKWAGGALANNGFIYCIPYHASSVLRIDPSINGATYTMGGITTQLDKWLGGSILPNGIIYCSPFNAYSILKIDTNTETTSQITPQLINGEETFKYAYSVVRNNLVYITPYNASNILVVDTTTDTISYLQYSFAFLNLPRKTTGGNIAPNGILYLNSRFSRIPKLEF